MSEFDLVIRGGRVVTAADAFDADVGVSDGRIVALAERLGHGAREIDAAGRLVLPGGVDSHCHVEQMSSMGLRTADDWFTATRSAACGGTTTILPFACQHRGQSLRQVVADYHAAADPKAVIDYAFHLIVSDPTPQALGQDLPALIRDGITSFKVYLTYEALKVSDRQFLDILALARREGALVMVHAENDDMIAWMADRLLAEGRTAPKFHAVAHAEIAEREATHRAIALAELAEVPILIVHVSSEQAVAEIRRARAGGLNVLAETCPQYLFLTADDLDLPGLEGAKFMCSPPPRDKANQALVWRALADGLFDVFSSDHAPYRYDAEGKLRYGSQAPFKKLANGVPGIELRLPLLFSEGVGKGRITPERFVALTATNAARLYGLHPRKGSLAVGADADIVLWDPLRRVRVTQTALHDAMDYTPYEGFEITGWPVTTLSRGEVIWDAGQFTAQPGRGRFYRCDTPPPLATPGVRP